jgi:hypothetical protein
MHQLDRLVGLSMLIAATSIFVYYTVWTLFMVRSYAIQIQKPPSHVHTLTLTAIC